MTNVPLPPTSPGVVNAPQANMSKAAVASLICGVAFFVPVLASLLAVLLGCVGLVTTRAGKTRGRMLAIAGIVAGIMGIFFWIGVGCFVWGVVELTKGPRVATHAFVEDLAADRVAAAEARTDGISPADLESLHVYVKSQGDFRDTFFSSTNINNDQGTVHGSATFSRRTCTVDADLRHVGGEWKIVRIVIRD